MHLWRPLSTTPATQGFPGLPVRPQRARRGSACCCASPIIGLWYWCTDQYIVQRVLTARGLEEARRGTIFAALSEARAGVHLPAARHDRRGAVQAGISGLRSASATNPQGAFPVLVSNLLPDRPARPRARRHAVRAHERARVAVQLRPRRCSRWISTSACGRNRASSTWCASAASRPRAVVVHRHDRGFRSCRISMSEQLYSYLQLVQSLLAPGDRRGVHGRHLLAARDAEVRPRRPRRPASCSACCACVLQAHARDDAASSGRRSSRRSSTSTGCTSASCCSCSRCAVIFVSEPVHAQGAARAARRAHLQHGFGADTTPEERRRPMGSGRFSTPAWSLGIIAGIYIYFW